MEKLNNSLPYVLIICGAIIAVLSFTTQQNNTKGFLGLIFIAFGAFRLYQKSQQSK
jgi:hypothetical protein